MYFIFICCYYLCSFTPNRSLFGKICSLRPSVLCLCYILIFLDTPEIVLKCSTPSVFSNTVWTLHLFPMKAGQLLQGAWEFLWQMEGTLLPPKEGLLLMHSVAFVFKVVGNDGCFEDCSSFIQTTYFVCCNQKLAVQRWKICEDQSTVLFPPIYSRDQHA